MSVFLSANYSRSTPRIRYKIAIGFIKFYGCNCHHICVVFEIKTSQQKTQTVCFYKNHIFSEKWYYYKHQSDMSQLKNTRSKRKHLPTEISVSLRTPKSRKYLFDGESASGTPKAQEHTDGNENIKKSKRKKLRKTQNLPQADDMNSESSSITVSRKKSSTKGSVSSAVDGDISSDVSQELEVKPKSKRKKMKLPEVNLNDFDDTLKTQKKKNVSMDSISSSTSDSEHISKLMNFTNHFELIIDPYVAFSFFHKLCLY